MPWLDLSIQPVPTPFPLHKVTATTKVTITVTVTITITVMAIELSNRAVLQSPGKFYQQMTNEQTPIKVRAISVAN